VLSGRDREEIRVLLLEHCQVPCGIEARSELAESYDRLLPQHDGEAVENLRFEKAQQVVELRRTEEKRTQESIERSSSLGVVFLQSCHLVRQHHLLFE